MTFLNLSNFCRILIAPGLAANRVPARSLAELAAGLPHCCAVLPLNRLPISRPKATLRGFNGWYLGTMQGDCKDQHRFTGFIAPSSSYCDAVSPVHHRRLYSLLSLQLNTIWPRWFSAPEFPRSVITSSLESLVSAKATFWFPAKRAFGIGISPLSSMGKEKTRQTINFPTTFF